MQGLGEIVLQLRDIIPSEGQQEGLYVCIGKDCKRHDGFRNKFSYMDFR